jgi:hypothetical protein
MHLRETHCDDGRWIDLDRFESNDGWAVILVALNLRALLGA